MRLNTYPDGGSFLAAVQGWLGAHESANSLVLGLAARLQADPNFYPTQPVFKTVEDATGLALAALMTPPHNLILAGEREDTLDAVRALVERLVAEGWELPGVTGPSSLARQFALAWSEAHGISFHPHSLERVFELTEVIPPTWPPGCLRVANANDHDLVARWWYDFNLNTLGIDDMQQSIQSAERRIGDSSLHVWDNGGPVSMAAWTRPVGRGISIGPVYTPPEHRRLGYASACVASLSQKMLDLGYAYVALFTDLANPTSNHIYQAIGYRPICDYDELSFAPPVP